MRRFLQLRFCSDGMTESSELRDAGCCDKFSIPLCHMFLIVFVRDTENVQPLAVKYGCICALQPLFDVLIACLNE
jgi:hypothetical protein